ncbi:MAG: hypothetical protein MJZ15_09575 [Bacteroidales bacterium]|nr:hypothetical protein [Bacteroidales bacterium]
MKMLEGSYFDVLSTSNDNGTYSFDIRLHSNHKVYDGHFPGNPVSPGVCSIEMIRECSEMIFSKPLTISAVSQCRFITVLTPVSYDKAVITITPTVTGDSIKVVASITDGADTTFVTYKGEYVA